EVDADISDGELDVVGTGALAGTLTILLREGNGTFAPALSFDARGNSINPLDDPTFVTVAGLNGHGKPDVLTANQNSITTLLNDGDWAPVPPAPPVGDGGGTGGGGGGKIALRRGRHPAFAIAPGGPDASTVTGSRNDRVIRIRSRMVFGLENSNSD